MYGAAIKQYIKENGIKYSFVAEKVGVDRGTLYGVLGGRLKLTIEYYVAICDALKLDLYYFVKKNKNKKLCTKVR